MSNTSSGQGPFGHRPWCDPHECAIDVNGVGTHTSEKVWIRGHRGDYNTEVFIEEAPGRDHPHMVVMSFEDGLPGPFITWPVDDVPDLLAVLADVHEWLGRPAESVGGGQA